MALGKHLTFMNPSFASDEERFKKVQIEDIPFMMSDDGAIVCIPKEKEVFSCAVVGTSGSGKSLVMNRMLSFLYYHFNCNVTVMNDVSEETFKWSEPMKCAEFNTFNEELNQKPIASPMFYFYPNTKDLELDETFLKNKNYLKIVIPFEEALEDIGFYLSGVNPNFELAKSGMYVNDIKTELLECETITQIRETLNEKLPGADGKSFQAMRTKIITAFDSLIKEEILDITNPECHASLKIPLCPYCKKSLEMIDAEWMCETHEQIEKPEWYLGNPFMVLMKLKQIPSFITSNLVDKKYKSEMFAYHINSIFKNNLKDFPGQKTFLFFDEIKTVCENDSEPAAKAIGTVAARGRMNDVGLVYATQFYDKIPNSVKGAKLNYLISFAHSSSKILNEIGSDFDLDIKTRNKIKKLKKFEVIAMTKNHFVFYRDGEKWTDNKPVRGKIYYPLSNHRQAGGGK